MIDLLYHNILHTSIYIRQKSKIYRTGGLTARRASRASREASRQQARGEAASDPVRPHTHLTSSRILLVNPQVPKMCRAYAGVVGPGLWRIRSRNGPCVAWKENDQQYPVVCETIPSQVSGHVRWFL